VLGRSVDGLFILDARPKPRALGVYDYTALSSTAAERRFGTSSAPHVSSMQGHPAARTLPKQGFTTIVTVFDSANALRFQFDRYPECHGDAVKFCNAVISDAGKRGGMYACALV
jgi:hypothetical protein